jgi:hypothetical protein
MKKTNFLKNSNIADKIYFANEKEIIKTGITDCEETADETSDTMANNMVDKYFEKRRINKKDREEVLKTLRQNIFYTLFREEGNDEEDFDD